jgi:hypothetical protein
LISTTSRVYPQLGKALCITFVEMFWVGLRKMFLNTRSGYQEAWNETTACETYAPHALSSVGTTPGRSRACRHHDFSKILEVRCGDRKEQFGAFWWIGAENGPSSDGSERFYMSYDPCSGGVPSVAPSPVSFSLAYRKSGHVRKSAAHAHLAHLACFLAMK